MTQRHRIGPLADLPEDEGFRVDLGPEGIALFRRGDRVFAVGDSCPHMGASLAEGFLDGDAVVCPWHGWVFSLKDGASPFDEEATVPVYRAVVEDGDVYVEVSEAPAPDTCSAPRNPNEPDAGA